MKVKNTAKIMHEVTDARAARAAVHAPGWSYAPEFLSACRKDGGEPRDVRSDRETRVYCEKGGQAYWEYVEGYAEVGPTYKGPPLNREYTVLYRAIAASPPAE